MLVGKYFICPLSPAGQMTAHLEGNVAVIERRYFAEREPFAVADKTRDRVTTMRVPLALMGELLARHGDTLATTWLGEERP